MSDDVPGCGPLTGDEIKSIKDRMVDACSVRPGRDWGSPAEKVTCNSEAIRLITEVERLRKVNADRDLHALLTRQFAWSRETFGEGYRMDALVKHIADELTEIQKAPNDPVEWIDVALLALDAAWRCAGISGADVADLFIGKMAKNRARKWPKPEDGKPCKHVKDAAELYEGLTVEEAWKKFEIEPHCPNGLVCMDCGEPQFITPGGPSCDNQHNGAEGMASAE